MSKHKVVIVGAGPVGLTLSLCLANKGIEVLLIDKKTSIGKGSRAICFARHNLALFDAIGVYEKIRAKGVSWDRSNIYFGNKRIVSEVLNHDRTATYQAYLNLQQYYLEEYLQEAAKLHPKIDIRLGHELINLIALKEKNILTIKHQDVFYKAEAQYLIAADGVKSTIRNKLNLDFSGETFKDKFLIADIERSKHVPAQRSFWFNAPFNNGKTVLMLKQPDNLWRIDFQLGWDVDSNLHLTDKVINEKVQEMLGDKEHFTIKWKSVYTFKCRRMKNFKHHNIFFIGDAAHEVSPFGARGANGGLQDAKCLAEKFDRYLNGGEESSVLDQFNTERIKSADENIKQSTRSTRFISPRNKDEIKFRNLILSLAVEHQALKPMINCGRLSAPEAHLGSYALYDDFFNILADSYSELEGASLQLFNQSLILLISSELDKKVLLNCIHTSLKLIKQEAL
jgi:3-(3-hydroxy-phenyl)propionate hydroxylase